MSHDAPFPGPGTRLNGIYEIERRLGAGGMGVVFRGRAIETGEAVAIKMLSEEMAGTPAAQALFRREASALRDLYDEAVVRYFAFAVDPVLGLPYMAMEFVEGPSLADVIRKGPLPLAAVDLLRKRLARGLGAAHRLGIVHRDISPDNVILPDGDPSRSKIIDFGIARQASAGTTIIGSGYAGKTGYMSPEHVGLFGEVTARSDVYSLGLVLAEALTGRALDMGGNPVEIVAKRRRVPDLGPATPMTPLVERMLQPDPARRTASMEEVAAWSLPDAGGATRLVGAPRAPRPAGPGGGGGRTALAAAVVVALLGAGTAGLLLWPEGPERPPASLPSAATPSGTQPDLVETAPASVAPVPTSAALPQAPAPVAASPTAAPQSPAPPEPTATPMPAAPAASDLVRAAQIELARVGCYAGPADGMLDAATRAGFEAFAKANDVTWSGDVQAAALDFLKAAPAGICAAAGSSPPLPTRAEAAPEPTGPDRRLCRELSERAQLGEVSAADRNRLRTACR